MKQRATMNLTLNPIYDDHKKLTLQYVETL